MSEQRKHTAGPWGYCYEEGRPGVPASILATDRESLEGSRVLFRSSDRAPSIALADARLIAAAPEMLEALRKVAMFLERLHGQEEKVKAGSLCSIGHYADYHAENITTIIRKATGSQD